MNTRFLRSTTRALALILFLSLGASLHAGSGDLLTQAYATLSRADHDYRGHRAAAMAHVEAAGKALGINVRGDGRGHEKQGVSDDQLRAAQGLLEQAKAGLRGKPLRQVNRAIAQINTALSIR